MNPDFASRLSADTELRTALADSRLVELLAVTAGFDPARFAAVDAYRDVERLLCEPLPTRDGRPEFILTPPVRIDALARILRRGGASELALVRREADPPTASALQLALDAFTLQRPWPESERDERELIASLDVWRWATEAIARAELTGAVPVQHDRNQIENRLAFLEVTRAPRKLVAGGVFGRDRELKQLHQYAHERQKSSRRSDPPMLVYGVGGVGKSTLVSRFVLDLSELSTGSQLWAWAYLDLDRPTLSSFEPAVLLADISRQLAAQFPESELLLLLDVRTDLEARSVRTILPGEYLSAVFDLADAVRSLRVSSFVIVLDTFEEAERQGDEVTGRIRALFDQLAGALPQLRLVVSGRAPARVFASTRSSERQLSIEQFADDVAAELLARMVRREAEVSGKPVPDLDDKFSREVVRIVGGLPLTLRLAARVIATEGPLFSDAVRTRTLEQVRSQFVTGFLYQRVLDHLIAPDFELDDALRQVARASLALRQVTAELIERILLPALEPRPPGSATVIYAALASEVALADESDGILRLRSELRGPALAALTYDDPELVRRVHRLAITEYRNRAAAGQPGARSELAYHRLALGEASSALGDLLDQEVLRSLEPSLGDLPKPTADAIRGALRDTAALAGERDLAEWERAVEPEVEAALRAGRFDEARRLLGERTQRTSTGALWDLASRLHEAEGELEEAIRTAGLHQIAMTYARDVTRFTQATVRLASLCERSDDPGRAVRVLRAGEADDLIAGYPAARLELLLHRINVGERHGLDDEDDRWLLELDARVLLQRIGRSQVSASPTLPSLLAAALGAGEPQRIRDAVSLAGLRYVEDQAFDEELADAVTAWDETRTVPGDLADALGLGAGDHDAPALRAAWQRALAGLGAEAAQMIERLWAIQEPPEPVLAALRAIYLWDGTSRPVQRSATPPGYLSHAAQPEWSGDELRELERLLLARYQSSDDLRRLAALARAEPGDSRFSGPQRITLRAILDQAEREDRMHGLIQAVIDDPLAIAIQPALRALLATSAAGCTHTLRLGQEVSAEGQHLVSIRLVGADRFFFHQVKFDLALPPAAAETLRWYVEDSIEHPVDPELTADAERNLADFGAELFNRVFGVAAGREAWDAISDRLATVRVEIQSDEPSTPPLPWELLRDPAGGEPLALRAASLVRGQTRPDGPPGPPGPPDPDPGRRLRVLLVTGPPEPGSGTFRPTARYLVGLADLAEAGIDLRILRPPTFARLAEVLEGAAAAGRPYHVLQYEGYSISAEPGGRRGLAFDDQAEVDGRALGALLVRTQVPALLLNACRSTEANAPARPRESGPSGGDDADVRGFSWVIAEAMSAGLRGAVALPYSIPAETAAQFIVDLYAALWAGQPLGAAVAAGRRQLAVRPDRYAGQAPRPVQDWWVPVASEAKPLKLIAGRRETPVLAIGSEQVLQVDANLPNLPYEVIGRDQTILALDRAFDQHQVIALLGVGGSGKTSTALAFARWYSATGGFSSRDQRDSPRPNPISATLYTAFDQYTPLTRLLAQASDAFGIPHSEDKPAMVTAVLGALRRRPVLWIWDGVEAFDTTDPWQRQDWPEIAVFVAGLVANTTAKLLVTARQSVSDWLGKRAAEVILPPLPERECLQIFQAIAATQGTAPGDAVDWRPLLAPAGGIPLAIGSLVRLEARSGESSPEQLVALADRALASRGGPVGYSLDAAFDETERNLLTTLSVFCETVDADALVIMGTTSFAGHVPELADIDRTRALGLLDRAAEVGLLDAAGAGYYRIHPVISDYLRRLRGDDPVANQRLALAYRNAIATLAEYYADFQEREAVLPSLRIEEANLLQVRALALQAGELTRVMSCMRALNVLYQATEQTAEWRSLVDELVPAVIDPVTADPRPGHVGEWDELTRYRVEIAEGDRAWEMAADLQRRLLARRTEATTDALTAVSDLTDSQRRQVGAVAATEGQLGRILCVSDQPEGPEHLLRATELFHRIDDRRAESRTAAALGRAYAEGRQLRDLDQAERWYRRSLDLSWDDPEFRARLWLLLGNVAYERFDDGLAAGRTPQELTHHLEQAEAAYRQAFEGLSPDAYADLATLHGRLGIVAGLLGKTDDAVANLTQSIAHNENIGDRLDAAIARFNLGITFRRGGRLEDATEAARAALRDFEALGDGQNASRARQLLDELGDDSP